MSPSVLGAVRKSSVTKLPRQRWQIGRLRWRSHGVSGWALTAALGCAGPLPPENPKTQLDEPADVVPIEVVSTTDPQPEAGTTSDRIEFRDIGLLAPESVLHDTANDVYLVANIDGSPGGVDGRGFISRLNPDGTVGDLEFIVGGVSGTQLNAPKGLWISRATLYVADIDTVRKFDVNSGAPMGSWAIPGATHLEKVTTDATGAVYVSDSGRTAGSGGATPNGSDALYKIVGDEVSVVAKGRALAGPNGIAIDGDGLLAVASGSATLTRYDVEGRSLAVARLPRAGLDGLVSLGNGDWLVSSWQGKAIYRGGFEHPFDVVVDGVQSPADIGFDAKRRRILIPLFLVNEVWAVPLAPPTDDASTGSADAAPSTAESPVAN